MHELAITKTLMEMLAEECEKNKIRRPAKIRLSIGALTNYKKEAILFYFDLLKKEDEQKSGLFKNSKLSINIIQGKIRCNGCKKTGSVLDPTLIFCGHCKSSDVDVLEGKQFVIEEITDGTEGVEL